MFCPECGKELVDGARFCTNCGTDVPKALGLLDKDEQAPETADKAKADRPASLGITSKETAPENRPVKRLTAEASVVSHNTGKPLKVVACCGIVCLLAGLLFFGVYRVMNTADSGTPANTAQPTSAPTPNPANPEATPMAPNDGTCTNNSSAGKTKDFPPTLPPVDSNDPNADLLSDHLGLYVDENGHCLSLSVATGEGINYFGAIYSSRADAENYANPLVEFTMGSMDEGDNLSFTFADADGNVLQLSRDVSITDYYTLQLLGDSHFNGIDMNPYNMSTFYMIEQYIDVMS